MRASRGAAYLLAALAGALGALVVFWRDGGEVADRLAVRFGSERLGDSAFAAAASSEIAALRRADASSGVCRGAQPLLEGIEN
jgi:hypothetical protein